MLIIALVGIFMQPGQEPEQPPNVAIEQLLQQVREIDDELRSMANIRTELAANRDIRQEQIQSLRLRFPTIALADYSDIGQIEAALLRERRQRAEQAVGISSNQMRLLEAKACMEAKELAEVTAKFERSDDFLALPLARRQHARAVFYAALARMREAGSCTG
jgi:hypothetical protein